MTNALVSPSLSALGLGDQIKQQLEDTLDEQRKKKLLAAAGTGSGRASMALGQSPAISDLFGDQKGNPLMAAGVR